MFRIIDGCSGSKNQTYNKDDEDDIDTPAAIAFRQFRVANRSKGRSVIGLPCVKKGLLPLAQPIPDVATAISHTLEPQIFERSIGCRLALLAHPKHEVIYE